MERICYKWIKVIRERDLGCKVAGIGYIICKWGEVYEQVSKCFQKEISDKKDERDPPADEEAGLFGD